MSIQTKQSIVQRPLRVRMRPDLVVRSQYHHGRRSWIVKDPVALSYFQLRDEEYGILSRLDGVSSLAEIKQQFDREFHPARVSPRQLQGFLGRLHQNNLILAEEAGQFEPLLQRRKKQIRRERLAQGMNLLAVRFRGFDPENVLQRVLPWLTWLFSPWFLAACGLLAAAALLLVLVQFDVLLRKLPEFEQFFAPAHVVPLLLTLAVVKTLHEWGHALVCKYYGGECHEMGVLLLVGAPCLYCNTTDSWLLASKWQRMAVSAAGMGVELVLASVCTFLWWFSEAGLLNTICLSTMFVCSVSTVIFNANPLLRYDGYYILSDWLEIPNLAERSRGVIREMLAKLCLGIDWPQHGLPNNRRTLLAGYAAAATLYRVLVITAILLFCHKVLAPWGLAIFAQLLTVSVVLGMVVVPGFQMIRQLSPPQVRRRISKTRLLVTLLISAIVLTVLLWVPLPYRITAPGLVEPAGAQRVYVSVAGTLKWAIEPGTSVNKGDKLIELEDLQTRQKVAELTSAAEELRQEVSQLEARRGIDPEASVRLPTAKASLAAAEKLRDDATQDAASLTLVANRPGVVLSPYRHAGETSPHHLPGWSGTPLDKNNIGGFLPRRTLACLVATPGAYELLAVAPQEEAALIRSGQPAWVQLGGYPGLILEGEVLQISEIDAEEAPPHLAQSGLLPAREDAAGVLHPLETSYLVRISLPENRTLLPGNQGKVRIAASSRSLGDRLWRYLSKTFRFSS